MRKGQAAVEFMITYGWAIMAAITVIGALAYFGLTNPTSSLPDKCIFSNAFTCKDQYINTSAVRVKLSNSLGETIYGINSTVNMTAFLTDTPAYFCSVTQTSSLEPDGTIEIICSNFTNAPFTQGDKIKTRISVYYANKPSGYTQVSLGEIYATVQ